MHNLPAIDRFNSKPLSEKIDFLESGMDDLITSLNESDLYIFFKTVTLDSNENAYVRRRMLALLTDCVLLKKIRIRHALNIIVDDWNGSIDIFLEVHRLKDLYYFFNEEREQIEKIYTNYLNDAEAEIAAESAFHLGLIFMQKGFEGTTKEVITKQLKYAGSYFYQATKLIENRIDASFFHAVVETLTAMLDDLWGNVKNSIKAIAQYFYQKEAFSFQFNENPFYLGFYRILNSLLLTTQEKPQNWLDIRSGLNHLYVQYAEINNQQLKERLNQSVVSSSFHSLISTQFVEPYYLLNFTSLQAKIECRLEELDPDSEEHAFVSRIKSLANQDVKKKLNETLQEHLKKMFPGRSSANIAMVASKITDTSDQLEILGAMAELNKPSKENFLDQLVNSCLSMQGDHLYRGDCHENDRNNYVSKLLAASNHYHIKDQPRWSISPTGKDAGEIDIFIYEKDGTPYSIIEALNLDSLKSDYLIQHLDKVFTYDTSGFELNFILVYVTAKRFRDFCKKYQEFILKHSFQYPFLTFASLENYPYTDIWIAKTKHERNEKEIWLYHILVNLI